MGKFHPKSLPSLKNPRCYSLNMGNGLEVQKLHSRMKKAVAKTNTTMSSLVKQMLTHCLNDMDEGK